MDLPHQRHDQRIVGARIDDGCTGQYPLPSIHRGVTPPEVGLVGPVLEGLQVLHHHPRINLDSVVGQFFAIASVQGDTDIAFVSIRVGDADVCPVLPLELAQPV